MTNLLDIVSLSEEVRISKGVTVTVNGVTTESLFHLMGKFPEVKLLMQRRASEITPERIMEMTPQIVAYIIGAGMTNPDTDDFIRETEANAKLARRIPLADQLKVVNKIFEITFPEGAGPFVEQIQLLTRSFKVGSTEEKKPESSSPEGLSASLVTDGPLPTPFARRRAS
jgi:hypothetical protein